MERLRAFGPNTPQLRQEREAEMSEKDLDKDYEGAGFGGRIGFGERPALVIIDFVRAYLEPECRLYGGPSIEAARGETVRLLTAARKAGIPVLHTNVAYTPGGADGGVFFRKVKALATFEKGADPRFQAFAEGLEPLADEVVITKQYASGFFGTTLAATLTALGADTVILAGLSTSGCIRATGLDACQNGFIPVVVRECVADRDARVHEANLFDLNAKYADVVGLDEALVYLETKGERAAA